MHTIKVVVPSAFAGATEEAARAVHTTHHAEVRMLEIHARIDDGDVYVYTFVIRTVDVEIGVAIDNNAPDSAGRRLVRQLDDRVSLDIFDPRVPFRRAMAEGESVCPSSCVEAGFAAGLSAKAKTTNSTPTIWTVPRSSSLRPLVNTAHGCHRLHADAQCPKHCTGAYGDQAANHRPRTKRGWHGKNIRAGA
jgi:hypothetical protein